MRWELKTDRLRVRRATHCNGHMNLGPCHCTCLFVLVKRQPGNALIYFYNIVFNSVPCIINASLLQQILDFICVCFQRFDLSGLAILTRQSHAWRTIDCLLMAANVEVCIFLVAVQLFCRNGSHEWSIVEPGTNQIYTKNISTHCFSGNTDFNHSLRSAKFTDGQGICTQTVSTTNSMQLHGLSKLIYQYQCTLLYNFSMDT